MADGGIGESLLRKEDFRFLTGTGNYTDDIDLSNQCYAVVIRSPHAHATIKSLDISKATKATNIIAVLTGDDVTAD